MRTPTPLPPPMHCDQAARLTTGLVLWPERSSLWHKLVWVCDACGARTGCHQGTDEPMGTMAGPALREARATAHRVFDALWKQDGWRRGSAYRWAAHRLDLTYDEMHIGLLDEKQCAALVGLVLNKRKRNGRRR